MRRLLVLTVLFALAVAPAADAGLARYATADGEYLSLKGGRGTALLVSRDGAVLGSVRQGRVRITDVVRGARTRLSVSGCERKQYPRPRTVVCIGQGLRFSVLGGAWRVRIAGSGINASAVMTGYVTLDDGTAGTYKIGNGPNKRWPSRATTFVVG
jgi:hypothetical protein